MNAANHLLEGPRRALAEWRVRLALLALAARRAPTLGAGLRALATLEGLRRQFMGDGPVRKLARVGGRTWWDLHTPGFPGPAFDAYHEGELNRLAPFRAGGGSELKTVVFALTRKCAQRCEHCFEWDTLNQPDPLDRAALLRVTAALRARGVAVLQLSGGEPLQRLPDVLAVLEAAGPATDCWLLTAGLGLTPARAARLRAAGLVGVQISLDHYEPPLHDFFRGFPGAFAAAEAAVRAARDAGLVMSLNLCVTRALATEAHLTAYMRLAQRWGVAFVQWLEPRAVGHYGGADVALTAEQTALLETLFRRFNHTAAGRGLPIVTYHGWHQRRGGCYGAGDRYLYVDAAGDLHACPFCQTKTGHAHSPEALAAGIAALRATGCHAFPAAADRSAGIG